MKKIKLNMFLLPCFLLIMMGGCHNENNFETASKKLKEIIANEQAHQENSINGFMDIPFNITKEQHNRMIDSLIEVGELHLDKNRQIYYVFDLPVYKVFGYYKAEFHNDSLYSNTVFIEPDTEGTLLEKDRLREGVNVFLKSLYAEKYKLGKNHVEIPSILTDFDLSKDVWIFGNTKIELYKNSVDDTVVKYTFIPVKEKIDEEEKQKKSEDKNKMKNHI